MSLTEKIPNCISYLTQVYAFAWISNRRPRACIPPGCCCAWSLVPASPWFPQVKVKGQSFRTGPCRAWRLGRYSARALVAGAWLRVRGGLGEGIYACLAGAADVVQAGVGDRVRVAGLDCVHDVAQFGE